MKTISVVLVASALVLGSCAVKETEVARPAPARAETALPPGNYETGGPLAGLKLPRFPTQHGEPAGYPGALPGKFRTAGYPEWELYPGSVEHYRDNMFKYVPTRGLFDRQSLLKNFVAPNIPGAAPEQVEQYAEPLYWVPGSNDPMAKTDLSQKPVPVVRCQIGSPRFKLDLGTLDRGLYAVRMIAAVETGKLRPFREPLFLRFRVNSGLRGEWTDYRKRAFYNDQFYGITTFYFHAPEKRNYQVELKVDTGSKVDLLVHNITVDNVLAGCDWKPLKTARTLTDPKAPVAKPDFFTEAYFGKQPTNSPSERLARDAAIWNSVPPLNAQSDHPSDGTLPDVSPGAAGKSLAEIETEYGKWEPAGYGANNRQNVVGVFPQDVSKLDQLLVNKKLNLVYTVEDLAANQPLPDPYPYKDDGASLTFPDPQAPGKGQVFDPIAQAVGDRIMSLGRYIGSGEALVRNGQKADYERDSAIALCRFAYDFPTLDLENTMPWLVAERGPYGREPLRRIQRNDALPFAGFIGFLWPIYSYDALFDYIKGNEDLARSVGRFVPWVKNSEDLRTLLDVYLVQTMAKRMLRYNYFGDGHQPTRIAELATAVGNPAVTDPWMEWLFSRVFVYPFPLEGFQNLMICDNDREGPAYLGSAMYCQGEGASEPAASLARYLAAGGNPKYDLSDLKKYPKPLAHCYWSLTTVIGGQDHIRIGDVNGPDKRPGRTLGTLENVCLLGWKWSADPKFAWVLRNIVGHKFETNAENQRMEAAAALVKRAPWLDNRSRAVANWCGILETGLQHDDYRFRRALYVRAGFGFGHNHNDSLDLQVFAHGLPMTVDGGQRGEGYSTPRDSTTRVHNTVEVNGAENGQRAWVSSLSDAEGARYLEVDGLPPANAKLFRRQVALIDVDEGQGSQPLSVDQQKPDAALPKGVVTGNSYVFDVFRVSGGQAHSYCFHGPVSEALEVNLPERKPIADGSTEDQSYLDMFKLATEKQFVGPAPKELVATWRMLRRKSGNARGFGSEEYLLGPLFDPQSPPKYTRLTLLGLENSRAYLADSVCKKWGYNLSCLMVRKTAKQSLESAYVALIEPYVGEPFLTSRKLLEIPDNESDALRAIAVEVQTKNGRTDVCFADGRPEKVRSVEFGMRSPKSDNSALATPRSALRIAGEFGYLSTDGQGLRQASLTGGTLLSTPEIILATARRERTAKVIKVDYAAKQIWIEPAWPASDREQVFEIGSPDGRGYLTSYTAKSIQPAAGNQSVITVTRGADYYRSEVQAVTVTNGTVQCSLAPPGGAHQMVASDDEQTRFWRAESSGRTLALTGSPLTAESFGPEGVLRLWEYGVGDTVRQSTFVSVRRVAPGEYEVQGDVDTEFVIGGKTHRVSGAELEKNGDRIRWKSAD